jgi:hypothetical protein
MTLAACVFRTATTLACGEMGSPRRSGANIFQSPLPSSPLDLDGGAGRKGPQADRHPVEPRFGTPSSLPELLPVTIARSESDSSESNSRRWILALPLDSPALTRDRAKVADCRGLRLDVGEEGPIAVAPQALFDQSPEDDLKAHGELERGGRPPRQDPGPIHDVPRKDQEDPRLVREHRTSRFGPTARAEPASPIYELHLLYLMHCDI